MDNTFPVWVILLAAGQGSRLSQLQTKKQFLIWKGQPLFWHSAKVFARNPYIVGITFVFPEEEISKYQSLVMQLENHDDLGINTQIVSGGLNRQDSVFSGIQSLFSSSKAVLIHDAARPFISSKLIQNIINALIQGSKAAIPVIPINDSLKHVHKDKITTLPRDKIFRVQTPQGFILETISQAHHLARENHWQSTDDAALIENMGEDIELVNGEEENIKITTAQDLMFLEENQKSKVISWSGWGYDVHRFGSARPMKLAGIPITNGPKIEAHSDGDVLLHAVIDALLGCLGQGDIGDHFPDDDLRYKNISSSIMLAEVLNMVEKRSITIAHLDATLICQTPKLASWKRQIKENLSRLLNLPPQKVNLKATTEEGLGFTGDKKGIKAVALITVHKSNKCI